MVLIEIDDKVWEEFARAWALLGVGKEEALVGMLEKQMCEESRRILEGAMKGLENVKKPGR